MTDETTGPPPDAGPGATGAPTTEDPGTPTDDPATPPGDGPDDAAGSPRVALRRTSSERVVAGVAGGLARTFDLDPVLVRVGMVVLCVVFPPVLALYVAAWVLVPDDDQPGGRVHGLFVLRDGGLGFWIGVAILAAVALGIADDQLFGGFPLVPLLLVGIGVALWTREGDRAQASTEVVDPGPSTASWPAPDGGTVPPTAPPPGGHGVGGAPPATGGPRRQPRAPRPPRPPRPPRERSALGAVTLGLALIAAGVAAALDTAPGLSIDLGVTDITAIALLVIGLGLLLGSVVGRARWLTLVALLLIPPVAVGTIVREVGLAIEIDGELDLGDGIGERSLRLTGAEELPDDLRLLAGQIDLDLTDWRPTADAREAIDVTDPDLTIQLGAGEVDLTLPADVRWRVVGEVGLGEIVVRDRSVGEVVRDSTDQVRSITVVREGGPATGPVLDIEVDVSFGQLVLTIPDDNEELS